MAYRNARGATLLEIIVFIGLLVVMVVGITPRFAAARDSALRAGIARQVEVINQQIEQFRLDHDDATPVLGGEAYEGWAPLVQGGYLVEPPVNALLNSSVVRASIQTPKLLTGVESTKAQTQIGWFYNEQQGRVIANGFDHVNGAFFDEQEYAPQQFAW